MASEALTEGLVDRLRGVGLPVCPRMRPAPTAWFEQSGGYCVLDAASGRCMLPSPEEFWTYCTSARFASCPWFADAPAAWKRLGPWA